MLRVRLVTLLVPLVASLQFGCADLQGFDLGQVMAAGMPLDQATVASGLKQALEIGTQRTTTTLSAPGGFGSDPVLRLSLPGQLGTVAQTLRQVGFSSQVDALEDSMNRAAEQAAAKAVPVFASAISSMTIADAFEILNGPDDAATRYFQERTSDSLRAQFMPVAESAMREVGFYGIYEDVVARYDAIPFTKPPAFDLERYVADQTLGGIFGKLAEEEALIREDPAARTTALLRRVFGNAGAAPPPPTSPPTRRGVY